MRERWQARLAGLPLWGRALVALLLLLASASARLGEENLNHYGLVTVRDAAAVAELTSRFKASGPPVFLVHDLKIGVSSGDILRFRDKAVIIDAAVLQTLKASGVLSALAQAPVIRLQAQARSDVWKSRSSLVNNAREKKAYLLGGELLKILEDYFGGVPTSHEMVLRFEGRDMVLYAPNDMLDRLQFVQVRKVVSGTQPQMVSVPPIGPFFREQPFMWQVWAADPGEPESQLRYSLESELPPGLQWNAERHLIEGALDSAGEWPVLVRVRNPAGASDSMSFVLRVRINTVPHFGNNPMPPLREGHLWQFSPGVFDEDHLPSDLRCFAQALPTGMVLDSMQCQLRWTPPPLPEDTLFPLVLRVVDPLGANSLDTFSLTPAGLIPEALRGIRFVLPLDTLQQGRVYYWPVDDLLAPGVELLSVVGADSLGFFFDESGKRILRMRPMVAGLLSLEFLLRRAEEQALLVQQAWVKPNGRPRFISALGSAKITEGEVLRYQPLAEDPEGDSLILRAKTGDGRFIRWNGRELDLWTQSPGHYTMEFIAEDGWGAPARQRIAYQVEPKRAEWNGLSGRYLSRTDVNYWWMHYNFGVARLGMFTPKLGEAMASAPPSRKEWVFGTVGASLLGAEKFARGNYWYVDAGLTLRRPAYKVITGGIMLGTDLRLQSDDSKYPWIFEFEFMVHANQAIMVVDTSGWSEKQFVITIDRVGNSFDVQDVNIDSVLESYVGKAYQKVLDDIGDPNNFITSLRLEGWMPVHRSIWAGPVYWREDRLVASQMTQHVGAGVRHLFEYKALHMQHALRLGNGGSSQGWGLWYDAKVGFGRWR